jgi:outer membrane lipoprotein SlyB
MELKEDIMNRTRRTGIQAMLAGIMMLGILSCSHQTPVLYPNEHLKSVGQEQAKRDIEECDRMAAAYIKSGGGREVAKSTATGAVGGTVVGGAVGAVTGDFGRGLGVGAAAGAASGCFHGLLRSSQPSPVHKNFADRCLREKGYEPVGWQ